MKQKRRVPVVLWRLFHNRARTLAHTLATLLPPRSPKPQCRFCNGRRCLRCCSDAMSFLLRPNDPSDYRSLLDTCFVVLSDNAPRITRFSPESHWSQIEIVTAVIETTMLEQSMSSNVICSGYNKVNKSSAISELLTSSAWCLLLERVGDGIMVYLLKNASIFLRIADEQHQQVTGPPVSNLCKRFNCTPSSKWQPSSLVPCGPGNKRKRDDDVHSILKKSQLMSSVSIGESSSSITCNSCCNHSENYRKTHTHISFSETSTPATSTLTNDCEGNLNKELTESLEPLRKRSRPYRWQRCRKHRQISVQEASVKGLFKTTVSDNQWLPGRHLSSLKPSLGRQFEQCYCLGFQVAQKVAKGAEIDRKSLFYNLERSSSIFPRKHVLNSVKPDSVGSEFLVSSIFGVYDTESALSKTCSDSSGLCLMGSACLYHSLVKLLKILIRRAQYGHHLGLLEKHCVVTTVNPNTIKSGGCSFEVSSIFGGEKWEYGVLKKSQCCTTDHCSKSSEVSESFSEEIKSHCLNSQVESFIWAVCRSIVPPDILNDAVHIVKEKLLESWIYWFFQSLVVPLLQANFYVTQSEHGKQDVYYYRKSVWEKMKNKTIMTYMDQSYQYLDDAATRRIIRKRSFGFSKLRIFPKEYEVRLLANLKASSKMSRKELCLADQSGKLLRGKKLHRRKITFERFKSVNRVLRDSHVVLKAMQLKEPGKLGSSVFDYNDVYRKLCPFLLGIKSGFTTKPDVFIIVSDVSKAFDSVNQDKLLGVLKDVIRADEYILQQSHHVIFKKGSLRVHENRACLDQNTGSSFKSKLCSVLVNQECSRSVKKKELFFNLHEHVKRNVLQLDKKFYLQRTGIPQGSILSALLCSLYYGHLDRNVIFPFLEKTWEPSADLSRGHDFQVASAAKSSSEDKISSSSRYTLLRFIDDFLFISTSKAQAASFFSRLQRGFRDYNCYMNEKKFCVNFDIGNMAGLASNRVSSGDDGILFVRWSGLLINSCTLEVQADYTKYLKNHLSSTLTVLYQGRPGHHLKKKLLDYMSPKCHPLFFDSHINSASVVRLNVYQAFLLCAMKFHCYVRALSYICKFHFRFYAYIIQRSLRFMYRLIKKRMCSLYTDSNFCPILQLEEEEVEWLGLYAYIEVLKRKQSRYKELLSLLKLQLLNHKICGSESSELSYAVDRSHSSLLWKIKY
ncbi:PREDICTED: telomerase reverse transcriptase-like [Fragaria vesca subsp. vesca]